MQFFTGHGIQYGKLKDKLLLRIKNIWTGGHFESSYEIVIRSRCLDYAGTRTVPVDSIRQVFEPEPRSIGLIGKSPGTRLFCALLVAGFEIAMEACSIFIQLQGVCGWRSLSIPEVCSIVPYQPISVNMLTVPAATEFAESERYHREDG